MISYLKGSILALFEKEVLIENGGIGYLVLVPARLLATLSPYASAEFFTFPHLDTRNNRFELFGFESKEELDFFKKLIEVPGVGPRMALGILSVSTALECTKAIEQEQADVFLRSPGVGRKTAQKIILELKGKLERGFSVREDELVRALSSLGYSRKESDILARQSDRGAPLAERLKHALKLIGKNGQRS